MAGPMCGLAQAWHQLIINMAAQPAINGHIGNGVVIQRQPVSSVMAMWPILSMAANICGSANGFNHRYLYSMAYVSALYCGWPMYGHGPSMCGCNVASSCMAMAMCNVCGQLASLSLSWPQWPALCLAES